MVRYWDVINFKKYIELFLLVAAMLISSVAHGQSSVLAAGEWWQLKVESAGIYRVGVAEIPSLQGVAVGNIGIYGAGGDMLSNHNSVTSTDDLKPLAIDVVDANGNGLFDAADYVLFFGEGADVWRYDQYDARYELRRHAYASANYYYLTTSATAPLRVSTSPAAEADIIRNTYTAVAAINNDLTNIFHTGQQWMGEKFSSGITSRSFTLNFPAIASGIKLRYAMAVKSSMGSSFSISTTGLSRSHWFGSNVYGSWLEAVPSQARTLSFDLRFSPGEGTAEGWLDFIEMTGQVPLTYSGGQTIVRTEGAGPQVAAYQYGGSSTPRVWDVTRAGSEREMSVASGRWSDSCSNARQYVLFDDYSAKTPAAIASLPNQDLHGGSQADFVIVCNPAFRSQADRLANLHAVMDGISVTVVTDRQVYNEFSSGKQDPMAIRAYLRHLRSSYPDAPPRWLLLFGKASYDPRDLLGLHLPSVVTYESPDSFDDDGNSYCSDDIMGYLDPSEFGSSSQTLDIGIGRLPARNSAEADAMVTKIEGYMTRRDIVEGTHRGDWRNYVTLLSDDADVGHPGDTSFAHSSEFTARKIKQQFPSINIDRLYADAFRQQSGAIGSYYPDLNNALRQRINYGSLILNYIGHGSQKYIGTERYIESADIYAYTNRDRLPVFVTSTCSYGWHDIPDDLCGAEMCLHADGAMVAVISASRPISHNQSFNTDLILSLLNPENTIGDALRIARNRTSVSLSIGLIGDPALHLSIPRNSVVVTHIDNHPVQPGVDDTATVLSSVTVSGEIHDADGALISDFDGTIYPIVFDRETEASTLANDNPGTELRFTQQKSVIYKGSEAVRQGRFQYSFVVPRDVQYQYDYGRLSHYAVSGSDDAAGSYSNLLFGGINEDVAISEVRPGIRLFIGDSSFRNGGITDPNPMLVAFLSDSVGINAFGAGLGHDITAVLDSIPGSLVVLNDFYQPDIDNPRGGIVRYSFSNLTPGLHTVTLKAWNIWGYSNSATVSFCVRPTTDPGVSSLTVSPNPASDHALFHYEVSSPEAVTSAILQIYSMQGALEQCFVPVAAPNSHVLGPVRWDLSGVAPGVYMARIIVSLENGETRQSTTKVIVR